MEADNCGPAEGDVTGGISQCGRVDLRVPIRASTEDVEGLVGLEAAGEGALADQDVVASSCVGLVGGALERLAGLRGREAVVCVVARGLYVVGLAGRGGDRTPGVAGGSRGRACRVGAGYVGADVFAIVCCLQDVGAVGGASTRNQGAARGRGVDPVVAAIPLVGEGRRREAGPGAVRGGECLSDLADAGDGRGSGVVGGRVLDHGIGGGRVGDAVRRDAVCGGDLDPEPQGGVVGGRGVGGVGGRGDVGAVRLLGELRDLVRVPGDIDVVSRINGDGVEAAPGKPVGRRNTRRGYLGDRTAAGASGVNVPGGIEGDAVGLRARRRPGRVDNSGRSHLDHPGVAVVVGVDSAIRSNDERVRGTGCRAGPDGRSCAVGVKLRDRAGQVGRVDVAGLVDLDRVRNAARARPIVLGGAGRGVDPRDLAVRLVSGVEVVASRTDRDVDRLADDREVVEGRRHGSVRGNLGDVIRDSVVGRVGITGGIYGHSIRVVAHREVLGRTRLRDPGHVVSGGVGGEHRTGEVDRDVLRGRTGRSEDRRSHSDPITPLPLVGVAGRVDHGRVGVPGAGVGGQLGSDLGREATGDRRGDRVGRGPEDFAERV